MGALAMCLGLKHWPSIHWASAETYSQGVNETRRSMEAVFNGLNLYLGNYIGEFLGEIALATFFLLTGLRCSARGDYPSGAVLSLLFLLGAFRNITQAVQVIANINNSLLPLWMFVLGAASRPGPPSGPAPGWVFSTNVRVCRSLGGQEPWTPVALNLGALANIALATKGHRVLAAFVTANFTAMEFSDDDGAGWQLLEVLPQVR